MLILLSLLACAPGPESLTPEELSDATYDDCVTWFESFCACLPDSCAGLTPEEECKNFDGLTCAE